MPKIVRFLQECDYVKEFGEGVDRMFKEMSAARLPAPEYRDNAFMLNVTIRNGEESGEVNGNYGEVNGEVNFDNLNKNELLVCKAIAANPAVTRTELVKTLGISARTIDRAIKSLKDKGIVERIGSDKTGHWGVIK